MLEEHPVCFTQMRPGKLATIGHAATSTMAVRTCMSLCQHIAMVTSLWHDTAKASPVKGRALPAVEGKHLGTFMTCMIELS